jgi:hypothetical protein
LPPKRFGTNDFLDALSNLDKLRRSGLWMCFQPSPLCLVVRIAEQKAPCGAMHDQSQVAMVVVFVN